MESLGVIAPLKSDTGWRLFSDADVAAATAWLAANSSRRRRATG